MRPSLVVALSTLWLAVIFFIAAAGAPQYYTYDKDNSVGAFRSCSLGSCRNYESGYLTSWARGLQAMIVMSILCSMAAATVMTLNVFKSYSYQHAIAITLTLFTALWSMIAFGIAADHFTAGAGWTYGASFVLNVLGWLLVLTSLAAYSYWVVRGNKHTHAPQHGRSTHPQRSSRHHWPWSCLNLRSISIPCVVSMNRSHSYRDVPCVSFSLYVFCFVLLLSQSRRPFVRNSLLLFRCFHHSSVA